MIRELQQQWMEGIILLSALYHLGKLQFIFCTLPFRKMCTKLTHSKPGRRCNSVPIFLMYFRWRMESTVVFYPFVLGGKSFHRDDCTMNYFIHYSLLVLLCKGGGRFDLNNLPSRKSFCLSSTISLSGIVN